MFKTDMNVLMILRLFSYVFKKKYYTHKSMKKKDCLPSNFDTPGFKFEISQYSTESMIKG